MPLLDNQQELGTFDM